MRGRPCAATIPPPAGFYVGMRIVTNNLYARVNKQNPGPRFGTVVAGSRSAEGELVAKLDDHKNPRAIPIKFVRPVSEGS